MKLNESGDASLQLVVTRCGKREIGCTALDVKLIERCCAAMKADVETEHKRERQLRGLGVSIGEKFALKDTPVRDVDLIGSVVASGNVDCPRARLVAEAHGAQHRIRVRGKSLAQHNERRGQYALIDRCTQHSARTQRREAGGMVAKQPRQFDRAQVGRGRNWSQVAIDQRNQSVALMRVKVAQRGGEQRGDVAKGGAFESHAVNETDNIDVDRSAWQWSSQNNMHRCPPGGGIRRWPGAAAAHQRASELPNGDKTQGDQQQIVPLNLINQEHGNVFIGRTTHR